MFYNISEQIQPGEDSSQRETHRRTTRKTQDLAPLAAVEDKTSEDNRRTTRARNKGQRGKKLDRQRDCKGKKGEGIKLYKKDKKKRKKKGKKMKQNATKSSVKYLCNSRIYYKYNVFLRCAGIAVLDPHTPKKAGKPPIYDLLPRFFNFFSHFCRFSLLLCSQM